MNYNERNDYRYDYRYDCRNLVETFRKLKGQPIEVITESGFKFCGIDIESDEDSVVVIDDRGRFVRILHRHIESVIEPQKRLERLCKDNDCCCEDRRHR